jgi:hypothetical protein
VDNTVEYTDDNGKSHIYSGVVKSDPVNIQILALPDKNKPPSFSGVVGKFEIKDSIQKTSITAGESNSLHIEISGKGEYEDINLPAIVWPAGFDHYAVHETNAGDLNKFPAEGKKVFDIPFVAGQTGNIQFPAVTFNYFDPHKKDYFQIQTQPILMAVAAASSKSPVETPVGSIRKINPYTWWITGISLITIIAGGGVFFYKRKLRKIQEKKLAEAAELARLAALIKPAVDYRKDWDAVMTCENDTEFLEKTRAFLMKFLQEKFETDDVLEEDILLHVKQPELMEQIRDIFFWCNRLLYAPTGLENERPVISSDMKQIMDKMNVPFEVQVQAIA